MKYSIVKINSNYWIAETNTVTQKSRISPEIGRFAQMRLKFMMENRQEMLQEKLQDGTLFRYLSSVEKECTKMLNQAEQSIVSSDKEYQELKKFDFRTQVAKVLQCSQRDSRKLLKLVEAELEKLNA